TPIALDHTAYLGDTVAAIATEKAGIIKPGAVAVLATQLPDAAGPLLLRAAEAGASVVREGEDFGVTGRELGVGGQRVGAARGGGGGLGGSYDDLFLPLFGPPQAANAACALAAVEAFSRPVPARGGYPPEPPGTDGLDEDLVRAAFQAVTTPGRLEVVR